MTNTDMLNEMDRDYAVFDDIRKSAMIELLVNLKRMKEPKKWAKANDTEIRKWWDND